MIGLSRRTRTPAEDHESAEPAEADHGEQPFGANASGARIVRRSNAFRLLVYGVLPAAALLLAVAAGWLKWQAATEHSSVTAGAGAVQAATDSTIAMLSYRPDTVEHDLDRVEDSLTGAFRDSYTSLIRDVVVPAAKQRRITATAVVPAAAVVSATDDHAVVLLSVDQTVTVGTEPPSNASSSVRVTLDHVGDRWLVSDFTPI